MKPKSEIKAAAKGAVSEDRALPNKTVTYFSWSMKLAAVSVFRNRSGTALTLLLYDGQGYGLCLKRFSQGRFTW